VFLLRNPLAVLSSLLSTYIKGDWPVLSFFRHDLLHAPQFILDGIRIIGDDAIIIRYEDLVAAPEHHISKLCQRLGVSYHEEMIDYSHTPAPIGKLNDPLGIHQHTRPSTQSLDKWKTLQSNPQTLHFAQSYLHDLGDDTINDLGYLFSEIDESLNAASKTPHKAGRLFPWDLAIRPQKEWTFREQYLSDKYFSIQERGYIEGSLHTAKKAIKNGIGLLKAQFSTKLLK